ncbi:MAG: phage holin family protein [Campylobacteraceae bacterium]
MSDLHDKFWLWVWLIFLAIIGGTIGFLSRNDLSDMKINEKIRALFLGIFTSMFVAYITFEIVLFLFEKEMFAVAMAGLAAYMGTNALVILENAFISYIQHRSRK